MIIKLTDVYQPGVKQDVVLVNTEQIQCILRRPRDYNSAFPDGYTEICFSEGSPVGVSETPEEILQKIEEGTK